MLVRIYSAFVVKMHGQVHSIKFRDSKFSFATIVGPYCVDHHHSFDIIVLI